MKYAIVFFNARKNRRDKKIKKFLNNKNKMISGIKSKKLLLISILIINSILVINVINKNLNKKLDNSEIVNEANLQDNVIETLKKYEISLDSIAYYDLPNYQKINLGNITLLNYTNSKNINFNEVLKNKIKFDKKSSKILLYSTHASESYQNSEDYKFEYSGTYRCRNAEYNMLKVGDFLSNTLKKYQINYYHNTTPHDYTSYINSYTYSRETLKNELKDNSYNLCIDLHRDALADLTQPMSTEINGKKCAQLMIVMGMGTSGMYNQYALDNLSFALNLQALASENYPGLFRPMLLRNAKYNQDLGKYSILIECGTTGNTFEEVENSMILLGKLLNEFYKN